MAGTRERTRTDNTLAIKRLAREQLALVGGPGISLRAISRDLGMVSSAIYRYFASRDDLLTALIVDAYDSIGRAAEEADASVVNRDPYTRWQEVGRSAYQWARDNPAEYGLIFGTPVPGYAAPQDTIGPATRFTTVLIGLLGDVQRRSDLPLHPGTPLSPAMEHELVAMRTRLELQIDDHLLSAGLLSWIALFGAISFIRFGHFTNVIDDCDAYFEHLLVQLAVDVLGLAASG